MNESWVNKWMKELATCWPPAGSIRMTQVSRSCQKCRGDAIQEARLVLCVAWGGRYVGERCGEWGENFHGLPWGLGFSWPSWASLLLSGVRWWRSDRSIPDSEELLSLEYRLGLGCPILTVQTSKSQKTTCEKWKKLTSLSPTRHRHYAGNIIPMISVNTAILKRREFYWHFTE